MDVADDRCTIARVKQTNSRMLSQRRRLLAKAILTLLGIISGAEAVVMYAMSRVGFAEPVEAALDVVALVVMSGPLVLWLVVSPLWRASAESDARVADREATLARRAERIEIESRLQRAFSMAHDEVDVYATVSHASSVMLTGRDVTLLGADSSQAHLRAVTGPDAQCSVTGPFDCPAIRQGQTISSAGAAQLDSCPRLRAGAAGASALCCPVAFDGQVLGVLSVGGAGESEDLLAVVQAIAHGTGSALGKIRAFEALGTRASTDGLTGLANRRHVADQVRAARRSGTHMSVVMFDLDHFKTLNDTYGHETGDKLLRRFAATLRSCARAGTIVGRWGGEEFVAVLPGAGGPEGEAFAERVRMQIETHPEQPGLRVSAGVAAGDDELEELLGVADVALYEAKRAGRNRVILAGAEQVVPQN